MSNAEKRLIETYTELFQGLSLDGKEELIKILSLSVKNDNSDLEMQFFASFGGFSESKSAEQIIKDLKGNRVFTKKSLEF